MTDQNYVQGIGSRLAMSAGFFIGTFVEVLELIAWSFAAAYVVKGFVPANVGLEESKATFMAASSLGALAGCLYVVYRFALKMIVGRSLVVPIPNNPNVDWYLSLRCFGIAAGGFVLGLVLLTRGLHGDPQLRDGATAPIIDAFLTSLAVGMMYLGGAKLIGRFTR